MVAAQPELPPHPGGNHFCSLIPSLAQEDGTASHVAWDKGQTLTLVSAPQPEIRWPCSIETPPAYSLEIPQKVRWQQSLSPKVRPGEVAENHTPFGQKQFLAAQVLWPSPGVQRTEKIVRTGLKIPESLQTAPRHRCVPLGPDHQTCRWKSPH